jgi:alpha-glucuronidase
MMKKFSQCSLVLLTVICLMFALILRFSPQASAVETLLSQGKTATAIVEQVGNEASKGNDGNTSTRFSTGYSTYPQWWKVDLGASYGLTKVIIKWYSSSSRYYQYKIEVSSDNSTFTTAVDKTGNTAMGDTTDTFTATGRYVRITVTYCSVPTGAESFYECEVYGNGATPTPTFTPTPTPIGTPTPTPTPTPTSGAAVIFEAENAVLSGVVLSTQYSGYSGTGYADYQNATADYIEWTVNAASACSCTLEFRYANGGTGDRPLEVKVNGSVVNSGLSFPVTGWTTWQTVSTNASLNAGSNKVRTTATGSSGGNIDYLRVTGGSVTTPTPTPTPVPGTVEDGYELWLRYRTVSDATLLNGYRTSATQVVVEGNSLVAVSTKDELTRGLSGLLNQTISASGSVTLDGAIVAGSPGSSPLINSLGWNTELNNLGSDGFIIRAATLSGKSCTVIAGSTDNGALYGAFRFLSLIQRYQSISSLNISDKPQYKYRLLNHWDNWNGSIERGYAGSSIFKWSELPGTVSPRYKDYCRACASVGLNGAVINNVNAQDDYIRTANLPKVAAIANVFRQYGMKLYLTVRFDSPISVGGLSTADPLDANVSQWWKDKANEIYGSISDFGGFLVKADSEGQPGPSQYGRTHAQGANMLADAIRSHGGIVCWRAFVYNNNDSDRAKRAYKFFKPLDGQFASEVILQVKNGPVDFQVREAVSPLIGGMTATNTGMELQITQEYTGQSTHLCWLIPEWRTVLDFDTQAKGVGSTVSKVLDGTVHGYSKTLIAGVPNIGSDTNWTRHFLHQANWYGYGRLIWNSSLSSDQIADEWVKMTYGTDPTVVSTIKSMLLGSWLTYEKYTNYRGTCFMCSPSNHYDPDPGGSEAVSYHHADATGFGYNRTRTGTGYVDQYYTPVADKYNNIATCPEEMLMWYNFVAYTYRLSSGKTAIQDLYDRHFDGVTEVQNMITSWTSLQGKIDSTRYSSVLASLNNQLTHATTWRDSVNSYFHTKSGIADDQGRTIP